MNPLKPNECVRTIDSIELEPLWAMDKRGIIIDLDNTLTPWREDKLTPDAQKFIARVIETPFKLCLLSNAGRGRVKKVAELYNIPYIAKAFKPFKKGYREALALLGLKAEQVVMVGDQIFTDILGGNRLGLYTILVTPVNCKEFPGTKLARFLERIIGRKTS